MGQGICNASFGELLQGVLPGNKKFLVNLKIKNASRVTLRLTSCQYSEQKEAEYAESYKHFSKSYKIIRNILSDLGRHDDFFLDVDSDIPIGKGLSSSTADMVASIGAAANALSIALKKEYIGKMLSEIEPNDGLHYPGTTAYHHTTGVAIAQHDYIPPLHILGIDSGGTIDTVEFNRTIIEWSERQMTHYQDLLKRMNVALESEDLQSICAIATESAQLWQEINQKPIFSEVLAFMKESEGLGLVNAHSGTFIGILYREDRGDLETIRTAWEKRNPQFPSRWFQTLSCNEKFLLSANR